jgi:hypothetical protein
MKIIYEYSAAHKPDAKHLQLRAEQRANRVFAAEGYCPSSVYEELRFLASWVESVSLPLKCGENSFVFADILSRKLCINSGALMFTFHLTIILFV